MGKYINGDDLLICIGDKPVAHCTSHSTTYSTETKERAVKPTAETAAGDGQWKDKTVVSKSVSISFEGLRYFGEDENGFKELLAMYDANEPVVTVKGFNRGKEDTPYMTGSFILTELVENAPSKDDATYSGSLENTGKVTIDTSKLDAAA